MLRNVAISGRSLAWQLILCWCVLLAAPQALAQEVVYIKRSDLWAYEFGQQVKQGVQHVNEFNGHMARRKADYLRLAEMKRQIASCGSCADRERLVREAGALEASLTFFDRMLCGTFEVTRSLGPSSGAVSRLLGVDEICRGLRLPLEPDPALIAAERKRIESGDLNGYARIGMHYIEGLRAPTNDWSDRANAGCPWLYRGSQLGNPDSLYHYLWSCMQVQRSTREEREEAVAMLQRCVAREQPRCLWMLGYLHSGVGGEAKSGFVKQNEQEALRLWDQAASKGHALSAEDARRLRNRQQGIYEPPPSTSAAAKPLPPVQLRAGNYRVFSSTYEGLCIVTALGGDRYAFDWRLQPRNSRRAPPPDRRLEAQVEGQTITFKVDDTYRTYNVVTNSGDRFVLMHLGQGGAGERLTWEGPAAATPAPPVARADTPAEPAAAGENEGRVDAGGRRGEDDGVAEGKEGPADARCRRSLQRLEALRERAGGDTRDAQRLSRAEALHARQCGR